MGKLLLCVIHSSRERYTRGKFLALSTLSVFATTPRVKQHFHHEIYLLTLACRSLHSHGMASPSPKLDSIFK